MDITELKALISEGENFKIEFKRQFSSVEKIAKELIAFANTKGGMILFGVDDDGTIFGVESEKSEIDLIYEAAREYCEPPIEPIVQVIELNRKDIVVAIVEESQEKPHRLQNYGDVVSRDAKVYIRINDKSVIASREVVKILESESPDSEPLSIIIGENERRLFKHLEENGRITVKEYAKLVNISERRASRTLVNLVRAGVIRIHTEERFEYFTSAF
ncbi:MAG: putative DNA binding domain-containing protein, partial [Bacteroidetes bacterium]|nr:putative DNA binding domain-containing protein [Bacteroidota bacterium]